MWGDRKHDVLGRNRRGMPTIGALWGYSRAAMKLAQRAQQLCANRHPRFQRPSRRLHARRAGEHHDPASDGRGPGSQTSIQRRRAPKSAAMLSAHGLSWADDYRWMRADNWREVLRDPAHLRTSAAAQAERLRDAVLGADARLAQELVREMRARLRRTTRAA